MSMAIIMTTIRKIQPPPRPECLFSSLLGSSAMAVELLPWCLDEMAEVEGLSDWAHWREIYCGICVTWGVIIQVEGLCSIVRGSNCSARSIAVYCLSYKSDATIVCFCSSF